MLIHFNVAMEIAIIVMMAAIFCAGVIKKEKSTYHNLLLVLIGVDISAVICDLFVWILREGGESQTTINILWAAGFILSYSMIILFHYMILSHISKIAFVPKLLYYIVIPFALVVVGIYLTSFSTGMFFTITDDGDFVDGQLAWVSQLIRVGLLLIDIVLTITYSRKIGLKRTVMLLIYALVPIGCQFLDESFRLCIIYLCVSVLIILDFIVDNIEQDALLARQKQLMAEQEKRIGEERTKIMISQIQPHFLYNVISSIMAFCKSDPDRACSALADFSDYLRTNMRSLTLEEPIPFKKELEHVKTYMRLEEFRFSERLKIEYDIAATDFFIPALTVQPLIENAVKHGVGQKEEGGKIVLTVREDKNGVTLTVSDDGVGFDLSRLDSEEYQKEDHIGIMNVRSRVESMCGGTLELSSAVGVGTTVKIFLPTDRQFE